jgi:hypothetical protein
MTGFLKRRTKLLTGAVAALAVSVLVLGQVRAQQPVAYPPEADKLQVVILVFGHKGGISAACQKDCKGIKSILEAAFAEDPERLVIHDLSAVNPKTGKYYTRDETLEVIKGLKPGKNDNVLIFQSGHGSIGNAKDPEMSHRLTMDGGTLTRAQVQGPIEAMKPRGIIFLTDCCSGLPKKGGATERELQSVAEPNVKTIRTLVLCPVGIVSITAAEDGKLAIAGYKGPNPGKAGSAFTVALLRLLYDEKTTYSSWEQFFPALKKETGLASGGKHMARAFQLNERGVVIATRENTPARVPTRELNGPAVPVERRISSLTQGASR